MAKNAGGEPPAFLKPCRYYRYCEPNRYFFGTIGLVMPGNA